MLGNSFDGMEGWKVEQDRKQKGKRGATESPIVKLKKKAKKMRLVIMGCSACGCFSAWIWIPFLLVIFIIFFLPQVMPGWVIDILNSVGAAIEKTTEIITGAKETATNTLSNWFCTIDGWMGGTCR